MAVWRKLYKVRSLPCLSVFSSVMCSMAVNCLASALTHSDGSGISESFLKIDAADADHLKGFDVLLCALM